MFLGQKAVERSAETVTSCLSGGHPIRARLYYITTLNVLKSSVCSFPSSTSVCSALFLFDAVRTGPFFPRSLMWKIAHDGSDNFILFASHSYSISASSFILLL